MHRASWRSLAVFVTIFVHVACAPYLHRYRHACFEEKNGLRVYERSATSTDTQGKKLTLARVGLPIKARVSRSAYELSIDTPLNYMPVVFLKALTPDGRQLIVEGPHVIVLDPGSGSAIEGYQYSFLVEEAQGAPLQITVRDSSGHILGSEVLQYIVRSRGIQYGIESL